MSLKKIWVTRVAPHPLRTNLRLHVWWEEWSTCCDDNRGASDTSEGAALGDPSGVPEGSSALEKGKEYECHWPRVDFSSEVERASALSAPSTCQQWHPGSNSQPASSSHAPPPPMMDKDEILLPSCRSARGCIWHETSPWTQVICYFQFAEIFRMKTAIKFYMDAGLYVEFAELLVFLLRWRSFDTPKILDPFSPDKFDHNRVWSVAEQRLMLDIQAFLECHECTLCLNSFQRPTSTAMI